MVIAMKLRIAPVLAMATMGLLLPTAQASFITWDSRAHSGDIVSDTPAHAHTVAGYVAAWNAIAGNAPTPGYGNGGFDDWTNRNNQDSGFLGANGNYGVHAFLTFFVPLSDEGIWTFSMGGDADYGGTVLLDGTELATTPTGFYPMGPSGSRFLTTGSHTLDFYFFEGCCDGIATSTFQDPLSAAPKTISSTNLQSPPMAAPEPTSVCMLGIGTAACLLVFRRRRA